MHHLNKLLLSTVLVLFSAAIQATTVETYICNTTVTNPTYKAWIPQNIIFAVAGDKIAVTKPENINIVSTQISRPNSSQKVFTAITLAKATDGNNYRTINRLTINNGTHLTYAFSIPNANMKHTVYGRCSVKVKRINKPVTTTIKPATATKPAATINITNNCKVTNPKACTNSELCSRSTYKTTSGETKWVTFRSGQVLVNEAISRGLNCGTGQRPNTQSRNYQPQTIQQPSTAAFKQQCSDIGYKLGTEKHADCVLQLMTNARADAQQQANKPTYKQAEQICDAESRNGAISTYRPVTPQTNNYNSNCRQNGSMITCTTTGGPSTNSFNNFANSMSTLANRKRLFRACMIRYGYEVPKPKNIIDAIFGD